MQRLANSKVIILGIGGVGSWCAESLVRTGLSNITISDLHWQDWSLKIFITDLDRFAKFYCYYYNIITCVIECKLYI